MLPLLIAVSAASAQDVVSLADFSEPLSEAWSFHDGSEFPGAVGSFEVVGDAGHDGGGGRLAFDFTGGGAYVQATLSLPAGVDLKAIEMWVRKPTSNRMTARAIDETGQTFQKSFNFASTDWQRLRVRLDGFTFSWGGADDGVFHGRPTAFGLLVERVGGPEAGVVDFDDIVGIPRKGAANVTVYEPWYLMTDFGGGKAAHYDLAGGDAVLYSTDESMLGRPQALRLRLVSDGSGREIRMWLYSHFQQFHSILGTLAEAGEMTLEAPLGNMNEWEHSGGENDGSPRMPMRVGKIVVLSEGDGPTEGDVELLELSVRTQVPPDQALFASIGHLEVEGRPAFEPTVRSLAPHDLDVTQRIRMRSYSGAVVGDLAEAPPMPLKSCGPPISTAFATDFAKKLPFLEVDYSVSAPGQASRSASTTVAAPWGDEGRPDLQPESPWGMGLYLYRYTPGADMERAASMAQAAGIKWSREEFLWHRIEPEEGEFDWSFYDQVVDTAEEHGISIYGLITYWSSWTESYTEQGVDDYCRYAQALVRRYKDRIHHWEIWNEPNIFFWSGPKELYFTLLTRAYAAIKEVDPDATVFGCSTAGIDIGFIRKTMAAGAPFDGLTIHPYRSRMQSDIFVDELQACAELVGNRPVWITEMGWSTQVGGTSERDQAALLARSYLAAIASGAVGNISWYDFREDGTNPEYNEHHFGVIRRDFTPKPAYRAAATVCRTVADAKPLGYERWPDGVRACRFARADGEVLGVWCESGPRILKFAGAPEDMAATNLMGEPMQLHRDGDLVALPLRGDAPVLIETSATGLEAEADVVEITLADPGLRAGERCTIEVTAAGEKTRAKWDLPEGWSVKAQGAGKYTLRVPEDALAGKHTLIAEVETVCGALVVDVGVEVVPDVVEV